MDAVKCGQPFLLTVRMEHGRPMDFPHLELCRRQTADSNFFLHERFVKGGDELADAILGTRVVRGLRRRITLEHRVQEIRAHADSLVHTCRHDCECFDNLELADAVSHL